MYMGEGVSVREVVCALEGGCVSVHGTECEKLCECAREGVSAC